MQENILRCALELYILDVLFIDYTQQENFNILLQATVGMR